jgi:hypothetical protein
MGGVFGVLVLFEAFYLGTIRASTLEAGGILIFTLWRSNYDFRVYYCVSALI